VAQPCGHARVDAPMGFWIDHVPACHAFRAGGVQGPAFAPWAFARGAFPRPERLGRQSFSALSGSEDPCCRRTRRFGDHRYRPLAARRLLRFCTARTPAGGWDRSKVHWPDPKAEPWPRRRRIPKDLPTTRARPEGRRISSQRIAACRLIPEGTVLHAMTALLGATCTPEGVPAARHSRPFRERVPPLAFDPKADHRRGAKPRGASPWLPISPGNPGIGSGQTDMDPSRTDETGVPTSTRRSRCRRWMRRGRGFHRATHQRGWVPLPDTEVSSSEWNRSSPRASPTFVEGASLTRTPKRSWEARAGEPVGSMDSNVSMVTSKSISEEMPSR